MPEHIMSVPKTRDKNSQQSNWTNQVPSSSSTTSSQQHQIAEEQRSDIYHKSEMWQVRTFQLFGIWLIGTGLLAPIYSEETLFWNAFIVSVLVGEAGLTTLRVRNIEGIFSMLLAIWLALSAFGISHTPPTLWMTNQIVVGVFTLALGTHLNISAPDLKVLTRRMNVKQHRSFIEVRKYFTKLQ